MVCVTLIAHTFLFYGGQYEKNNFTNRNFCYVHFLMFV